MLLFARCVAACVQTFSVELDDFCPSELFGSPAYKEAQAKLTAATSATNGSAQSGTAAAATPRRDPADADADADDDEEAYLRALDHVLEETWLRDGRMDLVESLRKETGREQQAQAQMIQAVSALSQPAAIDRLQDDGGVQRDFARLHALVDSLKHRDADPCLGWILDRKAAIKRQIMSLEADMSRAQEEDHDGEGTENGSASTAAATAATARRKRVSFSSDEKGNSASASAGSAASFSSSFSSSSAAAHVSVASLSPRLASLHSAYDALHTLQFDLHRLKFLQLLVTSEENTRAKHRTRAQLHKNGTRKRKNGDQQQSEDEEQDKEESNGSGSATTVTPSHPRKDRRSDESDIAMQDADASTAQEEEAALAADQTSSSSSDESDDGRSPKIHEEDEEDEGASDEDLNNLVASSRRAVGLDVPASSAAPAAPAVPHANAKTSPTSFSHHAALKYAQTFFPEFAVTRMEGKRC